MDRSDFKSLFLELIHNKENTFHPLVWISGAPSFGKDVYIGLFSEVNAKGARVIIGDHCDISSFVTINVADSHRRAIGLAEETSYRDIIIGDNVFIGSHSVILGGAEMGR